MRRIESPSSINTYNQCPRKYYYRYIEKRPTKPSIHLVRGSVAHKVLEDFYDMEMEKSEDVRTVFMKHLFAMFKQYWADSKDELDELGMPAEEIRKYFTETQIMLINWFNHFWKRFEGYRRKGLSIDEAFEKITPLREEYYELPEKGIKGYIDVVDKHEKGIDVLDYKTSKHFEISPGYRLQLAIYSFMYVEKKGRMPTRAGIHFLRHGFKYLDVNQHLVDEAKYEIRHIHSKTESGHKRDYPMHPSPLCKWSTGQCDFYELCFPDKEF